MRRAPPHSEIGVPTGLRWAPLLICLPFLFGTLVLFLISPYDWPVREWWVIYIYVPLVFCLLTSGFVLSSKAVGIGRPLLSINYIFAIGVIGSLALLVPTSLIYTGQYPWQVAAALADQKEAYSSLGQQLADTEGSRGPIAFLRAIFAPFVFSVLPIAIIYRRSLNLWQKAAAISVVFASIDLSILRGTTRELADILIIAVSAFIVSLGRTSITQKTNLAYALLKRWRLLVLVPVGVTIVLIALLGRTEARLGGQKAICLDVSGVCVSSAEPYRSMDDATVFGLATVSAYLGQGYYGLSLAAEKPFTSTYGVGHSPALSAIFVLFGGDQVTTDRAYTARARADGWSDGTQWSTMLAWIANDIGFTGAAIFVLLLGLAWGRAWINATQGYDDSSAIFFCTLMMMIFYLPANNQMMSTFDNYATLLFWGILSAIPKTLFQR